MGRLIADIFQLFGTAHAAILYAELGELRTRSKNESKGPDAYADIERIGKQGLDESDRHERSKEDMKLGVRGVPCETMLKQRLSI